jgi:hypothetical protein
LPPQRGQRLVAGDERIKAWFPTEEDVFIFKLLDSSLCPLLFIIPGVLDYLGDSPDNQLTDRFRIQHENLTLSLKTSPQNLPRTEARIRMLV